MEPVSLEKDRLQYPLELLYKALALIQYLMIGSVLNTLHWMIAKISHVFIGTNYRHLARTRVGHDNIWFTILT